jgi:pimeloyl-ACP methyl ester carboxylesterase
MYETFPNETVNGVFVLLNFRNGIVVAEFPCTQTIPMAVLVDFKGKLKEEQEDRPFNSFTFGINIAFLGAGLNFIGKTIPHVLMPLLLLIFIQRKKVKLFLAIIIAGLISVSSSGQANKLNGAWLGSIKPDLRLVFHFANDSMGKLKATLDSPDQGATGIPCSSVFVNADSLRVEIDVAKAVYTGTIVNDTTINGMWGQGGGFAPLNMKKVNQVAALNRPQTPKPSFKYLTEDVEYDNPEKTVHLAGTFTWPKGGGKYPVALLITGSGQQDRDETIFGHKLFAVLADYLTRQGIAVLRVDDRGVGKSTGDLSTVTSADFAKDVQAGINYLKTRPEVDTKKIGLIGHSEGGIIAPMVAAANSDVAFIVMWAAPVIGGLEINTEQNGNALKKARFSGASIDAFKQLHRKELELFSTVTDTTSLHSQTLKIFDQWRRQQPDSILKSLYVNGTNVVGQDVYKMYSGLFNLPWMRYFIAHDFEAELAKVKCKVLAINGELDTQVEAATNLKAIDSILRKNNNRTYKVVSLKGLNHMFQTANTGDDSEYGKIEETIAPAALELMASWINENVNSKRK